MAGGWLISYIVLWVVTAALALVVLAHSRLLGILHYRIGPAAAKPLADGPEIGARFERLAALTPGGLEWSWTIPADRPLLLVFISPQCTTCDALMPHVKDFTRVHPEMSLVLASTLEDRGMNSAYIAYRKLERVPYVMGAALSAQMQVEGTPYAVLLDGGGRVTAKGLVNHFEHLRSLRDAAFANYARPEREMVEEQR
jgi:methylamine dehydrogenase accessory protein MauD